ncbi:MAG: hypothetical protein KJ655_02770 [Candidatus Thermoplasmatota archaeon]|nr:hypothetical protein [Candidatus Thermoplasmatota archaeon]
MENKKLEDISEYLIPRFVINKGGERIGETIGMDGQRVILKKDSNFYSVPLSVLDERHGELIIEKEPDWEKAKILGERWRKKSFVVGKA